VLVAVGTAAPRVFAAPAGGSPNRNMVLTIDDLPAQRAPGIPQEQLETITGSLLEVLMRYQAPAIGFVNEAKLYSGGQIVPARVALLERWLEAGIELGNHTYSHPDLHSVPLDAFESDLLQGDDISRPLAAAHGMPYRYFRHPFLHTGRDLQTRNALERKLDQLGYRVAPVTVDNSEWIFARAYGEALDRRDTELQEKLGTEYVQYMLRMVSYYEGQSRGLFDREIPQVLLVHANAINAHYLDPLLAALQDRGYRFIDLDRALSDPAFESPDTYVGPGGITWLHRWALTRGVESTFFAGEPTTPQWVQVLAGIEE
jgi:peptidoglycan/xylan/chitin deacetylase (PgdA/CDA1 family)